MFPEKVHRFFYLAGLILLAISLPFSIFTLSVAQITLVVNAILEGKFRQKWALIKQRPALWAIALLYMVHLIWMANTANWEWGMHDLQKKLPLLVIPLVIGTSTTLSSQKLKIILNWYVAAIIVGSAISSYFIFGLDGKPFHSVSDYSPFVYPIQWSLMVVMATFIVFWLFSQTKANSKWWYIPIAIWIIYYLFKIQVLTGVVILVITAAFVLFWTLFQHSNLMLKWFTSIVVITGLLLTGSFLAKSYATFYNFEKIEANTLEKLTVNGNLYQHDIESKLVENGHYVNIYVCEPEMEKEWNRRSKINYNEKTLNGEELKRTLARYLTSKGLRKDSLGLTKLTSREIRFIEQGKTNYNDTAGRSLNSRLYVTWWELYNYKNGGNPSGYSIAQRLEALKTAGNIIKNNFWWGVGTGDFLDAFTEQYIIDNSPLSEKFRIRTHNQLVSYFVVFGILGLILILLSLVLPPIFEKKFSNYLFLCLFIIEILSFMDDDTLQTNFGIQTFAFFYSLFLFFDPYITDENKTTP